MQRVAESEVTLGAADVQGDLDAEGFRVGEALLCADAVEEGELQRGGFPRQRSQRQRWGGFRRWLRRGRA